LEKGKLKMARLPTLSQEAGRMRHPAKGLRSKFGASGVGLRPESFFYDEAKTCADETAQVVVIYFCRHLNYP
jgi:hypothetical protein